MCSIAGLIAKNGIDVSTKLKEMLELTVHRGPDGAGIAIGASLAKASAVERLPVDDIEGTIGLGHSRLKITGDTGIQPLLSCDKRFVLACNGEIWNYRSLRDGLEAGGHHFLTDTDSEILVHLVEEQSQQHEAFSKSVAQAFDQLDGEFAFALFDMQNQRFALVRDRVGIKQLYYDTDSSCIAFCSEKKPLWSLGLDPKRVLPGEIVEFDANGTPAGKDILRRAATGMRRNHIHIRDESEALRQYSAALNRAVEKRVREQDEIGIIFSGGVDSVVIAQLAKTRGANITCYATGFPESPDVTNARRAAEALGLKLVVSELSTEKIEQELENIIIAIESTNHLQVDVAIPIFFAVQQATKDGIRVMLTGQGADELFAGYPWYPEVLREEGPQALNDGLWNDIQNLYKDTLEREDKITMYHSIELRVPYLDPEVIEVATAITEKLKIKDGKVKYIHRKLADELGIPAFIAWRKKEAAQHGSNVHAALKKILAQRTHEFPLTGDKKTRSPTTEELGSAYRYTHEIYSENAAVQSVLDGIGEHVGIST